MRKANRGLMVAVALRLIEAEREYGSFLYGLG
jgi:hypothetical protein